MHISAKQIIACGISPPKAKHLVKKINSALGISSPIERWKKICREILLPEYPFALHLLLHKLAYHDWDENRGPAPVWLPDENTIKKSNLFKFQKKFVPIVIGMKNYNDLYKWSVCNRKKFWEMTVKELGIKFKKPYKQLVKFSSSNKNISSLESPCWFADAEMNIADSCFHPELADKTAIVFQQENSEVRKMSYQELESLANRVAKGLLQLGLKKNDTVAVCMTMTAEAVSVYLGIVKAGCAVVSIADSLAAEEVQKRLEISKAKLLFTQDFIVRAGKKIPFYEKTVQANPEKIVCLSYSEENKKSLLLRKEDLWWEDFLNLSKGGFAGESRVLGTISCSPSDTINILFSSGTTGEPKAIPWNHTTPIKCAADGFFHHNIQTSDVIAWPTNIGWMMGPWLIFASLINRATIALFYDAPTSRSFGEFVQNVGVTVLGLVPSIVKRWRETDCMKELDWSKLKIFSSTGEASNPQDYFWLMSRIKGYRPVIEYCGGTEIGGGYITGTVVQPAIPSAFTTPSLGLDFIILDENGQAADNGELFLVPPSVGLSTTLLNKDHHEIYFADSPLCPADAKGATGVLLSEEVKEFSPLLLPKRGRDGEGLNGGFILRSHGDQVEKIKGGFFRALGRADDTMNLGGIKVSSAEIERVLNETDGVVETAAIAVNPPGGGPSLLVIYTVLTEKGKQQNSDIKTIFQQQIKQRLNPLFKIHDIIIVDSLPRTASNKVMRRVLRKQYEKSDICRY